MAAATDARKKDPFRGFRFLVQIGGITSAGFREVSGLDIATDTVDYREGDDPRLTISKLPGLRKYANLILKRGITDDKQLWEWRNKILKGEIQDTRKSIQIILQDIDGNATAEWHCLEAWPSSWSGPHFNATASEVAIETLEISHEGLERVK